MRCIHINRPGHDQALSGAGCSFLFSLLFIAFPHFNLLAQDSRSSIDSLTAIAERQLTAGEIDSARDNFEAALDINKKDISALIGLGKTYFMVKKWRSARDEFEKVLKTSPGNLEAHYYAAICYREMGKTKAGPFRANDWKNSRIHFQMVAAVDSSLQDVLHQFSILEEYDKEFEHALELAHAELRLRKDLTEPQMDLFKLYHHFIFVSDTEDSFAWLRVHPSLYARYFTGEVFRAANRPDDATRVFEGMLQSDSLFPREASLLSLVRIRVNHGDSFNAERLYWQAVDNIHSQLGADLVFDDMKDIMSDEELRVYHTLATLERKQAFFRAFWNLRNPLAGSHTNARLIEHYRRMLYAEQNFTYYGFRIWFNNPDKTSVLHFPQSYTLNHRFNDKGLIYLRHGPPNEIERAAGLGPVYADPNESWLYYGTPESPKWIFNFVAVDGSWRLAPLPTDTRMYDALAPWDARYGRLTSRIPLERLNTSETLTDASRENVTVALSTDEHNWKRDVQQFRILSSVDAFRSDAGHSLLDISYAIPMPVIARVLPDKSQATCEVGISITNLTSRTIANKLDTISFLINRRSPGFITNLFRYVVKPDSYAIALHVHPLGVEAFGRWKTRTRVQDFSSRDFLLSDLQFLMPSSSSSSIEINGMKVIQVPFTIYRHGNPVYVYYQAYNLAPDNDGQTSFTTEYSLTPADDQKSERRILLMKSDRKGNEESSAEFAALNIDKIEPGKHILSVRVTDHHRGRSSERSRIIELVEE